jgi:pullulanase
MQARNIFRLFTWKKHSLYKKKRLVQYTSFEDFPIYRGDNLGIQYSSSRTVFRIWSPGAERIKLSIYEKGEGENLLERHLMNYFEDGVWVLTLNGDYAGRYYTFNIFYRGEYLGETPGIYAKAVGVNGKRAMVLNLNDCNPAGWKNHKRPELESLNDIVIYELHVRDFTIHNSSGCSFPGKYLGLVENGTINMVGFYTGINHLNELGITHVHLLPVFDFNSIDESNLQNPQFNWGYDPDNYNVPEGSYSTDPHHAEVRIQEFKEMVMKFHQNGIRVIMDVVYNHTGITQNSNFNLEVPGYYYRFNEDGEYSNASGCNNETASERPMMRKFMIDSCKFWATEYKIDGFRFDLMGIHDIETMNLLCGELKKIDASIFVYGEGWTAGESPLSRTLRALKENSFKLDQISLFSDDIRDAIRGNVFEAESLGFVAGGQHFEETIKFGVVGSTEHPQINYRACIASHKPWASNPALSINYCSCHDNHILFDKLMLSAKEASLENIVKMYKLANAIILTSQGIPFIQSGIEFLRTKKGEHNTFNLPDEINQIDWNLKTENIYVFEYIQKLIFLRKEHPAFRMPTTEMISCHLEFLNIRHPHGKVAFIIKDYANNDKWRNILVVYNAADEPFDLTLPPSQWTVAVKGAWVVPQGIEETTGQIIVPAISMMLLFQ